MLGSSIFCAVQEAGHLRNGQPTNPLGDPPGSTGTAPRGRPYQTWPGAQRHGRSITWDIPNPAHATVICHRGTSQWQLSVAKAVQIEIHSRAVLIRGSPRMIMVTIKVVVISTDDTVSMAPLPSGCAQQTPSPGNPTLVWHPFPAASPCFALLRPRP